MDTIEKLFRQAYKLANLKYSKKRTSKKKLSPFATAFCLNATGAFDQTLYNSFIQSGHTPTHSAQIRQFGKLLVEQAIDHPIYEFMSMYNQFFQSEYPEIRIHALQSLFDMYKLPTANEDVEIETIVDWSGELAAARRDNTIADSPPYMLALSPEWRPGTATLNCVGITQMLIALFQLLGLPVVAVHPIQGAHELMWNVRAAFAKAFHQAGTKHRNIDIEYMEALARTAEIADIKREDSQFHIAVAVELWPDSWWIFDPYIRVLYQLPPEFQMADKVALLHKWQKRSPGLEIQVASTNYLQDILERFNAISETAIELGKLIDSDVAALPDFDPVTYARLPSVQLMYACLGFYDKLREEGINEPFNDYLAADIFESYKRIGLDKATHDASLATAAMYAAICNVGHDALSAGLIAHPAITIADPEYALGIAVLQWVCSESDMFSEPEQAEIVQFLAMHTAGQTEAHNQLGAKDSIFEEDYGKIIKEKRIVKHKRLLKKWKYTRCTTSFRIFFP